MPLTESQKTAQKKWNGKNKGKLNYLNSRSSAKAFIKDKANKEDLEELRNIIEERENYLDRINLDKKNTTRLFSSHAKNLVIDSKSRLMRDPEYQQFYDDFKSIKGDPLIGVWDHKKIRNLADLSNCYDKYPKMIQELKNGKFEKVIGYYYDYEGTKFYEDYTPVIKKDTKQEQDKLSSDIAEKQAKYDGETEFSRSDFLNLLSKTIEPV